MNTPNCTGCYVGGRDEKRTDKAISTHQLSRYPHATPDWEKAIAGHKPENAILAGIEMYTHGKSTGFLSGKKFTAQELWDYLVFVHEYFLTQSRLQYRQELVERIEEMKLPGEEDGISITDYRHNSILNDVIDILKD